MTRLGCLSFGEAKARLRPLSFGGARDARARRFGLVLATTFVVLIGSGSNVLACPACFGAEETSMIDGARLGVLVMLAITLAVQGAFAGFFFYLRSHAKRMAEIELDTEWSELQRGSRPS